MRRWHTCKSVLIHRWNWRSFSWSQYFFYKWYCGQWASWLQVMDLLTDIPVLVILEGVVYSKEILLLIFWEVIYQDERGLVASINRPRILSPNWIELKTCKSETYRLLKRSGRKRNSFSIIFHQFPYFTSFRGKITGVHIKSEKNRANIVK